MSEIPARTLQKRKAAEAAFDRFYLAYNENDWEDVSVQEAFMAGYAAGQKTRRKARRKCQTGMVK